MNTGNDILFFMFIIIALFFIGTIVYLKRNITKLKKYLLFLSDKNKAFLFVILLFNVIWIPAVYVAHKYLGAFDTWQNSLLIIIVFIFVFILFNTGMIISFFEAWYQNNTQINNIEVRKYKKGSLWISIIVSIVFLYLVIAGLFYPELIPKWLYNILLSFTDNYNQ